MRNVDASAKCSNALDSMAARSLFFKAMEAETVFKFLGGLNRAMPNMVLTNNRTNTPKIFKKRFTDCMSNDRAMLTKNSELRIPLNVNELPHGRF